MRVHMNVNIQPVLYNIGTDSNNISDNSCDGGLGTWL